MKKALKHKGFKAMAEAERFELPWGCPQMVFKNYIQVPKSSRIVPFNASNLIKIELSSPLPELFSENCEKIARNIEKPNKTT